MCLRLVIGLCCIWFIFMWCVIIWCWLILVSCSWKRMNCVVCLLLFCFCLLRLVMSWFMVMFVFGLFGLMFGLGCVFLCYWLLVGVMLIFGCWKDWVNWFGVSCRMKCRCSGLLSCLMNSVKCVVRRLLIWFGFGVELMLVYVLMIFMLSVLVCVVGCVFLVKSVLMVVWFK